MTVHPSVTISTSNLYLFYDIGNSNSYSGSGSTITDLSGNNRNGTIYGATYSSEDGGVLVFDGANDSILPSNIPDSLWKNSWTASFWVRVYETGRRNNLIQHGSYTVGECSYLGGPTYPCNQYTTRGALLAHHFQGGAEFWLYNDNLTPNVYVSNVDIWDYKNIVFTCKKNTSNLDMKIYIDGDLFGEKTSGGLYVGTGGTRFLGRSQLDIFDDFYGRFSSVALYNTDLSASTIQSNYEALSPGLKYGMKKFGSLSFSEMQTAFGGSHPISMSEYYDVDDGVPASGLVSIDNFRGKGKFRPFTADVYAVGGGGGGGYGDTGYQDGGGGGGAGGEFESTTITPSQGDTWTITLGAGGTGATRPNSATGGGTTTITGSGQTLSALGGGRGGNGDGQNGANGGGGGGRYGTGGSRSGGGNGGTATNTDNNPGGAGGGGSTYNGANGNGSDGGNGGASQNNIPEWFYNGNGLGLGGGGGGGAGDDYSSGAEAGNGGGYGGGRGGEQVEGGSIFNAGIFVVPAEDGVDGYGGGGGGGYASTDSAESKGGDGGKGGVFIYVPANITAASVTGTYTTNLNNGYDEAYQRRRYYWFTSSGTITW